MTSPTGWCSLSKPLEPARSQPDDVGPSRSGPRTSPRRPAPIARVYRPPPKRLVPMKRQPPGFYGRHPPFRAWIAAISATSSCRTDSSEGTPTPGSCSLLLHLQTSIHDRGSSDRVLRLRTSINTIARFTDSFASDISRRHRLDSCRAPCSSGSDCSYGGRGRSSRILAEDLRRERRPLGSQFLTAPARDIVPRVLVPSVPSLASILDNCRSPGPQNHE